MAGGAHGTESGGTPTRKAKALAGRIMYVERKADGLTGRARIGRVTFSKTGRTLYYQGRTFQSLKGAALSPITTASRRRRIIGFPDRSGGVVMHCMEEACPSK